MNQLFNWMTVPLHRVWDSWKAEGQWARGRGLLLHTNRKEGSKEGKKEGRVHLQGNLGGSGDPGA